MKHITALLNFLDEHNASDILRLVYSLGSLNMMSVFPLSIPFDIVLYISGPNFSHAILQIILQRNSFVVLNKYLCEVM